jgi:hypothetical protein
MCKISPAFMNLFVLHLVKDSCIISTDTTPFDFCFRKFSAFWWHIVCRESYCIYAEGGFLATNWMASASNF